MLLITVSIMVVICYAVIGVGPRTLGRQHSNGVALAGAPAVRVLGRMFNPLAALLTLFGNAITPGRAFATGRSPPRSSCASSSTWPSNAAWSSTTSGR